MTPRWKTPSPASRSSATCTAASLAASSCGAGRRFCVDVLWQPTALSRIHLPGHSPVDACPAGAPLSWPTPPPTSLPAAGRAQASGGAHPLPSPPFHAPSPDVPLIHHACPPLLFLCSGGRPDHFPKGGQRGGSHQVQVAGHPRLGAARPARPGAAWKHGGQAGRQLDGSVPAFGRQQRVPGGVRGACCSCGTGQQLRHAARARLILMLCRAVLCRAVLWLQGVVHLQVEASVTQPERLSSEVTNTMNFREQPARPPGPSRRRLPAPCSCLRCGTSAAVRLPWEPSPPARSAAGLPVLVCHRGGRCPRWPRSPARSHRSSRPIPHPSLPQCSRSTCAATQPATSSLPSRSCPAQVGKCGRCVIQCDSHAPPCAS